MDIFWIKKLASMLLMPIPLIIILLVCSVLLFRRNKKRIGSSLFGLATCLLMLFSTPWLPNLLLEPLEHYVPQYDQANQVEVVVVLGCDHSNDFRLSATSQLRACSLYRLMEGVRVMRANPGSQLLLSGGSKEEFSNAEAMLEVARAIGVDTARVILQTESRDTEEEAIAVKAVVEDKAFALVTSAYHMRRALRIFANQNLHPVAAPTEHFVKRSGNSGYWFSWFPRAVHLRKTELYWYETLGYWWLRLRGL